MEKREKGDSRWVKAAFSVIPDTKHRVTGLIPKKTYEFRVCAINAAGPGAYSDCSEPIAAQHAPCVPRIDLSMMVKDVLAFAGDPITVGGGGLVARSEVEEAEEEEDDGDDDDDEMMMMMMVTMMMMNDDDDDDDDGDW